MPRFRPACPEVADPVTSEVVRQLAEEMLRPAHFFLGPNLSLECQHVAREELVWEIYRGRLLDPAHTRQRRVLEAWNIHAVGIEGRSAEPLLALKLDVADGRLHVVRGLECYVWEGYDSGSNVILSRERRKWVRELVGTLELQRFAYKNELQDELARQLFHAVVGRRLPLTSVEAPLPAFSFGQLFYCYRPGARVEDPPLHSWQQLVDHLLPQPLAWLEKAKLLETFLHTVGSNEWPAAAERFTACWTDLGSSPADLMALLRTLFNEVSLTPYTDLADKTLTFLACLEQQRYLDAVLSIDFLGYLLRQLGRHLTAYDLVTFHHRGANYPDALLLDAVLNAYLSRIEHFPTLFLDAQEEDEVVCRRKRLWRRALRQGWLLRRRYENHPVPEVPTSPGENNRVLPPSHPRVPEEQILQPARRTKRLYADDPLTKYLGENAAAVLRQSIADLHHPEERRELGLALFLDRPLGFAKAPGEPDATPLLSCEAYSQAIAQQRLRDLAREAFLADCVQGLPDAQRLHGLPLEMVGTRPRPGVVALGDARQAAPDFVFQRTTTASLQGLLDLFDFRSLPSQYDLDFLIRQRQALIAQAAQGPGLVIYDGQLRPRLEMEIVTEEGYCNRAGREYPAGGLRILHIWDTNGVAIPLAEPLLVRLLPCLGAQTLTAAQESLGLTTDCQSPERQRRAQSPRPRRNHWD